MPIVASWNVNSVKARLPLVLNWLQEAQPDIVVLQELKCETQNFPRLEFQSIGYDGLVIGQKSWNGVAILAKGAPVETVLEALPGDEDDAAARYGEVIVHGLRIGGLYLPNGNPVASEKYPYKLRWMARLEARAKALLEAGEPFLLTGDFNVIPEPEDCYSPEAWAEDALFRPDTRQAWRQLMNLGLTDAFRSLHPDMPKPWTFWDYTAGRWPRDQGIRIDHILLSPALADRLEACWIDRTPRALEKASDHTPVLARLSDNFHP